MLLATTLKSELHGCWLNSAVEEYYHDVLLHFHLYNQERVPLLLSIKLVIVQKSF